MNINIIYYNTTDEINEILPVFRKDNIAIFVDSEIPIDIDTDQFISIESEEYEKAFEFIFHKLDTMHSLIEKAIIFEYLYTHYPRIIRCLKSFEKTGKDSILLFIKKDNMNVFDLSFDYNNHARYYTIENSHLKEVDLYSLVHFYTPYCGSSFEGLDLCWTYNSSMTSNQDRHQKEKRVLFVVHDNEYNLYLKPYYPIFDELTYRDIPFTIMACDDRSEKFLSTMGYHYERLHLKELPIENEEIVYCCVKYYKRDPNTLFDFMFNLAFNSAHLPAILRSYKNFSELSLADYTDVFYVPDGTPTAFYIDHIIRMYNTVTHSIVSAGVFYYRSVSYYLAKNIYCYGLECKKAIEKIFKDKHVVLSGNPSLYVYDKLSNKEIGLELKENNKIVLIATSGYDEAETEWMEYLFKNINAEDITLILKPHPYFKDRYKKFAEKIYGHILLPSEEPIEKYISFADLIITDHSQVGKDAHLLGKPVISMTLTKRPLYLNNINSIIYCDNKEYLITMVRELLADKKPLDIDKNFIDNYNYGNRLEHYKVVVEHLLMGCDFCSSDCNI